MKDLILILLSIFVIKVFQLELTDGMFTGDLKMNWGYSYFSFS
uniref:Uncharacterized protein n=1 Tax=Meloidogyne enterolobii TaxID=390850 RepID=A0A6V7WI26_MELEN|nr:unnamed protein product [Meloidogyne enterolobii]